MVCTQNNPCNNKNNENQCDNVEASNILCEGTDSGGGNTDSVEIPLKK